MFLMIRKFSNMNDESDKAEFLKKYGTFFNEFKSGSFCLFYLLFVARRPTGTGTYDLYSQALKKSFMEACI